MVLIGVGLALGNWISLVVCVLIPLAAYVVRIRVEEGALEEALGDAYLRYEKGEGAAHSRDLVTVPPAPGSPPAAPSSQRTATSEARRA